MLCYAPTKCCCGCGEDVSTQNHFCTVTNKRIMSWCIENNKEENYHGVCKGCFTKKANRKYSLENQPIHHDGNLSLFGNSHGEILHVSKIHKVHNDTEDDT